MLLAAAFGSVLLQISHAIGVLPAKRAEAQGQLPEPGFIAGFAGSSNGDGFSAIHAFVDPIGITTHRSTDSIDLYVADNRGLALRRVDGRTGVIDTVAEFDSITAVTVDAAGTLYMCDGRSISRVDLAGNIEIIAGTGTLAYTGDGGPATEASFGSCIGITIALDGTLYFADNFFPSVRRIRNGIISTVAGTGTFGNSGDGGPATAASFINPSAVVTDSLGNLYIADSGSSVVRRVDESGIIDTVVGNYVSGYSGDGGPARTASLNRPAGLAIDSFGNLLIADKSNHRVRVVLVDPASASISPASTIETIAGTGTASHSGDGGPAHQAGLFWPRALAVDDVGNIYVSSRAEEPTTVSYDNRIRKIEAETGVISLVVGLSDNGDGQHAELAVMDPWGVAASPGEAPDLYIADVLNNQVRKVDGTTGVVTTAAGTGEIGLGGDGGPAVSAQLGAPRDIAADGDGNVFVADTGNHRIRLIDRPGTIRTYAGSTPGYGGDGGPATNARLNAPRGVALDGAGNLYIADMLNHRVRKVATSGVITTFAGTGLGGWAGDGGAATAARLDRPADVAVAPGGAVYVAERGSNRIRRVDPDGTITTAVGNGFTGFSGDGGPATAARLNNPASIAFDNLGNLYLSDWFNYRIRRVDTHGIIETIAGTGTAGNTGDAGPAREAEVYESYGLSVDDAGHLYLSQPDPSNRVRVISLLNGPVSPPSPTVTAQPSLTAVPTSTPTPTSTPIYPANTPPPTATPAPPTNTPAGAALLGQVTLEGRPPAPDPRWSVPVEFTLTPVGAEEISYTCATTTDNSGGFHCSGFEEGTYVACVKQSHTLRNCMAVNLGPTNDYEFGVLREGDATNDNCILLTDFSLLSNSFGKCVWDAAYEKQADFDLNVCVDVLDFSLMVKNFGVCGDGQILAGAVAPSQRVARALLPPPSSRIIVTSPGTTVAGQTFETVVEVDAGEVGADAAAIFLDFDPAEVELVDVQPDRAFASELLRSKDPAAGSFGFAAGSVYDFPTGRFELVRLTFLSRRSGGAPPIEIVSKPSRKSDVTFHGYSTLAGYEQVPARTSPSENQCPGDCDGNAAVTVDELLALIRTALDGSDTGECSSGDLDGSGSITIDEIAAATVSVLDGCARAPRK